jgi:hypothetical protein
MNDGETTPDTSGIDDFGKALQVVLGERHGCFPLLQEKHHLHYMVHDTRRNARAFGGSHHGKMSHEHSEPR